MQNNYILLNKNNELLSFYYGKERGIYCEKIENNNYSTKIKIIENVLDNFTVNVDYNKDIYIFCQNYDGDIILCKIEKENIVKKVLLQNENIKNTLFYPIFVKNNMSLIYNKDLENGNSFLSIRTLINQQKWSNEENIDVFYKLNNNIFDVQKINENHLILAYQKKYNDVQIGYKEIKEGNISNFITIHKTGYQVVDYSFIAFRDEVHYLYIIRSLFSSQVIYRRKGINGIENPIVIFEGQRIKNCSISVMNNILYCSFVSNNNLFYCKSEDFGRTFLNIIKYEGIESQDIIKAKFLSYDNIRDCSINDIYIDGRNHLNLFILQEVLPNLFNKKLYEDKQNVDKIKQNKFITSLDNQYVDNVNLEKNNSKVYSNVQNNEANVYLQNDFMANFNPEEFSQFKHTEDINIQVANKQDSIGMFQNNSQNLDENPILENRLKMLNREVSEKNSQILKLNEMMQNKNKQQMDIEMDLRQKIKNKQDENNSLLEQIEKLKKEIEKYSNKDDRHKKEIEDDKKDTYISKEDKEQE